LTVTIKLLFSLYLYYSKIQNAYQNIYNNNLKDKDLAINSYADSATLKYAINNMVFDDYESAEKYSSNSLYENAVPTYTFNKPTSSSDKFSINPINYYDVKYTKALI